jgi:succinate dehydrogenase/fumarate reductase flavoprotein subunit
MSRYAAVVRDAAGLIEAADELDRIAAEIAVLPTVNRAALELRNMVVVARAIVESARLRQESRGAHFRRDFPAPDPTLVGRHLVLGGAEPGWRYDSLAASRGAMPAMAG